MFEKNNNLEIVYTEYTLFDPLLQNLNTTKKVLHNI